MASEQLQLIINAMRAAPRNDNPTVQEQREGFEAMTLAMPLPDDVRVEKVDAGGVPAEWVSIEGASPAATLLHLHGGGYVIGSLNTHRKMAADIARAANARVLLLDYRLAPEHPYPAAVDDATGAYRWLLAQGIAPGQIVITGDSAGGGLTAATLLALRENGHPLPAAAVLMSPWLDLTNTSESMTEKAAADVLLTKQALDTWAGMYADDDLRNPLASPLFGGLSGLPPLLVQVGTAEVLLDDSTRFAERAKAAGVDVTLEVWDNMIHIWPLFSFMLPEGQQAIDRIGAYVKERVAVHA